MTKQMSFCDEDCETRKTLVRVSAGGGEGAGENVGQADDARAAYGDQGDVVNGG